MSRPSASADVELQIPATLQWVDSLPALFGVWYCCVVGLWAPMLLSLGYRPLDVEFLTLGGVSIFPALLAVGISRSSRALAALLASVTLFMLMDLYVMDVVDPVIGVVDFSLLAIPCWLLRARIAAVLGAGSLAFTVSVALTAPPLDPPHWASAPAARSDLRLPPVIHLILDEHCGTDCFPSEVMADDERGILQQAYVDRGFTVWSGVRSTDITTRLSLAAMMNPASATPGQLLIRQLSGFETALTENRYFERMTRAGYRIRVLQTSFFNFCVPGLAPVECRTYQHNSAGVLRTMDLELTERLRLLTGILDWSMRYSYDTVAYRELLSTGLGATVDHWRATDARRRLQPLVARRGLERVAADLASIGPGDLYVAHLLVPHHPYVFNRECRVLPVEQWADLHVPSPITSASIRTERYERFKAQVICADRMVAALLDDIADQHRLQDAIIIVHGDHGSRIGPSMYKQIGPHYEPADHDKDFRSVLFSTKSPDRPPGTRTVANVLLPEAFWSIMGPVAGLDSD